MKRGSFTLEKSGTGPAMTLLLVKHHSRTIESMRETRKSVQVVETSSADKKRGSFMLEKSGTRLVYPKKEVKSTISMLPKQTLSYVLVANKNLLLTPTKLLLEEKNGIETAFINKLLK